MGRTHDQQGVVAMVSQHGESVILAKRGGWRFWLRLLAVVGGLAVFASINLVEYDEGTGGGKQLLYGVGTLAGIAWLGQWAVRCRVLLVDAGDHLVMRDLLGTHEVDWDRVSGVSPIESGEVSTGGMARTLLDHFVVAPGWPRSFGVGGCDRAGKSVSTSATLWTVADVDGCHEAVLSALGQRFGHVDRDWWDAATDAKGTPAAASEEQRRELERLEAIAEGYVPVEPGFGPPS